MTIQEKSSATAAVTNDESLPVAVASLAPSAPVELSFLPEPAPSAPAQVPSIFQPPTVEPQEEAPSPTTFQAPVAPKTDTIHRPSNERVCRICKLSESDLNYSAEQEAENPLIRPCYCDSYVHSRCLQKWRLYQNTREFAACGVCHFHYHLKGRQEDNTRAKRWNKVRMIMTISSDFLLVTLVVQAFCIGLAAAIYFIDSDHYIAAAMDGLESCVVETHPHVEGEISFFCSNVLTVYYGVGIICFLALVGMGWTCCSNCVCFQKLPSEAPSVKESQTKQTHKQPSFYQRYHTSQNCCTNAELACSRKVGYICTELKYSSIPCCKNNACKCGCCTSTSSGHGGTTSHYHHHHHHHHRHNRYSSGGGGNSNSNNKDKGGGGAPVVPPMLIFVAIVIIIFAILGFVVAMMVSVILAQRIFQGRIYMIHKKRLVKEFPVLDLDGIDLEDQSRPALDKEDLHSLQKVGLLCAGSPYGA